MEKKQRPVQAFLLLGGNTGNVQETLAKANDEIRKSIGKIVKGSSLYQTAAWGKEDQDDFLNQVVIVKTQLSPRSLLKSCLQIEKDFGRIRTEKNAPRNIDIDILFYASEVIDEEGLEIPHPRISQRRFVLTPLDEIAPRFIHPSLKKPIHSLLKDCEDKLSVLKL